jgi:T4 bacteriophage base plate protein.
VSCLVVDDEVFNKSDMSEGEIEEWLESLTTDQFKKVTSFFETMPKLKHSFTIKNTNTGKNFTVVLEGLADFF